MTLQARYAGYCENCGQRFEPGALIRHLHTDEHGTSFWGHVACPDEPDDLTPTHPVCTDCWLTHPEGACDR